MELFRGIVNFYNYLAEDCADPRTKEWVFIHSPVPITVIAMCYYYFIRFCGPRYMKDREAYSLKTYIKVFNVFQIITNAVIMYAILTSGWLTNYTLGCVPVDYSPDGEALRMASTIWWVLILKLVDLTETMVFVFRKKNNQISFLHVYHHISTVYISWMSVKWMPGGMVTMVIIVNSGVHIVMYTFYLLTTGGRKAQMVAKWIKPWITIIQMAQFCFLLGHSLQGFLPSCIMPKVPFAINITNLFINLCLFYHFYQVNYVRKQKKSS